ncbi:hypothetical protein GOODEAATRI_001562 [Goodea atripinnis]|uniref:Uncharacterized protein n=1 Tax=Goodea atripinnis TaxID=208336 RepID=A0ABV0P0N1_9TELE
MKRTMPPSSADDFLLIHYDKGPCRNKLGHSRASVIWHRTQVRTRSPSLRRVGHLRLFLATLQHVEMHMLSCSASFRPLGPVLCFCNRLVKVVGIFAGFGLLLLVASPFLLLATPIVLCCKCKCSKGDDDPLPT